MIHIPLMDISPDENIKKIIVDKISSLIDQNKFIGGKEIDEFEKNFAMFSSSKFCVGCSNGTDAIILALKALDISNSDYVIVPVNTFIATAEAVTAVGAKILFVDCLPFNQEINYDHILQLLEKYKNIKAIIPVHLYGHMVDIIKLNEIAKTYNLKIIEDSSQAHGAKYKNYSPGHFSQIATYSFYPGKNLGAFGDAGAITTNYEDLYIKIKQLRNHGRIDKKYEHDIEGFNKRLDTIQAAILDIKLKNLQYENNLRKQKAKLYNTLLNGIGDLILPIFDETVYNDVWYVYTIRTKYRDKLIKHLNDNGIQTGIYYPIPLHLQKAYSYLGHKLGDFPNAEKQAQEILSLPMWPYIKDEQIEYISSKIKEFFK